MSNELIGEIVKYALVAFLLLKMSYSLGNEYERAMWRLDCALKVPSACGAIEEKRAQDWILWSPHHGEAK